MLEQVNCCLSAITTSGMNKNEFNMAAVLMEWVQTDKLVPSGGKNRFRTNKKTQPFPTDHEILSVAAAFGGNFDLIPEVISILQNKENAEKAKEKALKETKATESEDQSVGSKRSRDEIVKHYGKTPRQQASKGAFKGPRAEESDLESENENDDSLESFANAIYIAYGDITENGIEFHITHTYPSGRGKGGIDLFKMRVKAWVIAAVSSPISHTTLKLNTIVKAIVESDDVPSSIKPQFDSMLHAIERKLNECVVAASDVAANESDFE
jgi:hypothetical protein